MTLAGRDILRGRTLYCNVTADDYAHVIIACLTHDVRYIRGLFKEDDDAGFVSDPTGKKVKLPRGSSDASLLPYDVNRSKLYVMERIEGIALLDKKRISGAIEGTRFPTSVLGEEQEYEEEASIVRAADFIGHAHRDERVAAPVGEPWKSGYDRRPSAAVDDIARSRSRERARCTIAPAALRLCKLIGVRHSCR